MVQREAKSPEQLKAEAERIETLRGEIKQLVSRVPGSVLSGSVLSGSVQVAIAWKKEAHEAMTLANSKQPKLEKLMNAVTALDRYNRQPA